MKKIAAVACVVFCASFVAHGQKGVDAQTKTIKDEGNKVTTRSSDAGPSFSWGKGKTKLRPMLANPYKFTSRRDALVSSIVDALHEKKLVVDEAASRPKDGVIVTLPFVFARGAVITQNELNRYGVLDDATSSWTRGQYTLMIEVQPIDGTQNNVSVNAKIEGRAGNGLTSEWLTVKSSGAAEDEFLSKLVALVTGVSPDPETDQR
jgi:hypothetical protein